MVILPTYEKHFAGGGVSYGAPSVMSDNIILKHRHAIWVRFDWSSSYTAEEGKQDTNTLPFLSQSNREEEQRWLLGSQEMEELNLANVTAESCPMAGGNRVLHLSGKVITSTTQLPHSYLSMFTQW